MAPDGSSLLTLGASSVQMAPDGSRRIVWMIIGMIKAHPTEHRMPRRSLSAQEGLDVRPVNRTVGPSLGLDINQV
jgi:hypothetical protein